MARPFRITKYEQSPFPQHQPPQQSDNVSLELFDPDSGLLPNRLTTAQRNGISNPAVGLTVYNTDTSQLESFDGSEWQGNGDNVTLPDLEVPLTPGPPPEAMIVTGLIYNSSPPTVADGETVALQGDDAGNLKVTIVDADITIGAVSQEGTWVVGINEPLPVGANTIGGVVAAPTSSSGFAIAPVVAASATNVVGKASPGNLYEATVNVGVAAGYVFKFNSTTVPANGSVTAGTASGNYQDCVYVPANGTYSWSASGDPPENFSTGITIAFSSTGPSTFTAATAVVLRARVQ